MSTAEPETRDYEKLGAFYLGRPHDLAENETALDPMLYDSKDLTTHAVCVGMTGSGKTGLCLSLLEEAGIDGVPAIVIDPKGDIGNLLLTFPDLAPSDFRPWIDEGEAARKGVTPDEFAEKTATLWRDGLASWGQDGDRIRRFREAVEMTIYTPGSDAGVPLTVLRSFDAPPEVIVNDREAFQDRIGAAASGLLALLGIDVDPVRSREHILISNILNHAWQAGDSLDLSAMIRAIQDPPFDKVGVMDLESVFPAKDRLKLSMQLNNLLAAPGFASWLEGEPVDIKRLLYTPEGKPRISVVSIAHMTDEERMFFVTFLLGEVLTWMRTQPGTSSLRALLYMDEVFGYFPPSANPPSKKPMLTLLKQARAFGVGCVLATQNPVDLDYKGLSNTGTWFLGRLQTERDKMRVLEGLEGASAQAGSSFNRQEMEATLAGLGKRVFLMNNVHEDEPVVFQTRWAMSYLRGPLTRSQIKTLMADRKSREEEAESEKPDDKAKPEEAKSSAGDAGGGLAFDDLQPAGKPEEVKPAESKTSKRPTPPPCVEERFLEISTDTDDDAQIVYRPAVFGAAKLHYIRVTDKVDDWQARAMLKPIDLSDDEID
ncbi:MAG: ATP-binding protein, partial [Pirellulales bacterium]|nr:ATP-binding protein [Pirellulales bacterium]